MKTPTTATTASRTGSASRPLAFSAALLLLLCALGAAAQPAAKRTVRGQVLDENDKVVAGALVHLTNLSTKEKTTVVTDKEGRYQFNDVSRKFDFEVSAELAGKKGRPRRLSQFDPRDIAVFNFKLEPPGKNAEKKDNP